MATASAKLGAALIIGSVLSIAHAPSRASDRWESTASVTIVRPVAMTVVNSTPLQAALLTTAIAPVGVVFSAPSGSTSAIGGGGSAGGTEAAAAAGNNAPGASAPSGDGTDLGTGDGASVVGLAPLGGSLTGTTIDGDAVSVSVGNAPAESGGGGRTVAVVIAQYN
ncbi:MAG: hypothetical protein J7485_01465 [Sphingobium sp.]|nr:hypothetical protein [Sphingobium sp.]